MKTSKTIRPHNADRSVAWWSTVLLIALGAVLLSFLMVGYFVSFVDRVNLGFAALQMVRDLKLSSTVFGLGGGIFFLIGTAYYVFVILVYAGLIAGSVWQGF